MSSMSSAVSPQQISRCEKLIRPYIRRTPVIEIDGADVGLEPSKLSLKLELFQHSGSFKARGAFANLLTRKMPAVGVVAASGGNHGAAVAYAAMTLGVPAKIFVPSVSSPAKVQRIREYGADLVIEGIAMPTHSPQAKHGSRKLVRCLCTHSTKRRPCLDRGR